MVQSKLIPKQITNTTFSVVLLVKSPWEHPKNNNTIGVAPQPLLLSAVILQAQRGSWPARSNKNRRNLPFDAYIVG
jgi:hypothetical protein